MKAKAKNFYFDLPTFLQEEPYLLRLLTSLSSFANILRLRIMKVVSALPLLPSLIAPSSSLR